MIKHALAVRRGSAPGLFLFLKVYFVRLCLVFNTPFFQTRFFVQSFKHFELNFRDEEGAIQDVRK
ncbi:uncharacterized protein P174DRAFT_441448 [Aspergillus novofumigatus IBT 16806]|uniref:Uncharacterized protein n=1 Tax=Aspergillus novofumigatus (strain IBT 16806) TaxID=1392255 RepID=A0A2I1C971_ASPN1|nr:uncharacterized protein P174DRAFT_441448 [Aspergillus novofumigatus IBT 16806]PKX94164.1 hypothetical protein P174DRAFT_441448 [Aspergillus novofumigatus IBT 16806]